MIYSIFDKKKKKRKEENLGKKTMGSNPMTQSTLTAVLLTVRRRLLMSQRDGIISLHATRYLALAPILLRSSNPQP